VQRGFTGAWNGAGVRHIIGGGLSRRANVNEKQELSLGTSGRKTQNNCKPVGGMAKRSVGEGGEGRGAVPGEKADTGEAKGPEGETEE